MGYLTTIKYSMYVISKENNVHCLSRAHIIVIMSWLIISCPITQYFAHIHSQSHNLIIPTMPSQNNVYGHNTALRSILYSNINYMQSCNRFLLYTCIPVFIRHHNHSYSLSMLSIFPSVIPVSYPIPFSSSSRLIN